jgi:hypothetical protein
MNSSKNSSRYQLSTPDDIFFGCNATKSEKEPIAPADPQEREKFPQQRSVSFAKEIFNSIQ